MRRFLSLTLSAFLCLIANVAWATDYIYDDNGVGYYIIDGTNVAVAYQAGDCNGVTEGDVVIPATFTSGGTEYTVKELGSETSGMFVYGAFRGSSVTSVTVPDGVTTLNEGAFQSCKSLTSVSLPTSLTTIDDMCFYECSTLTEIVIPEGVTSIGCQPFAECQALTSITLPATLTKIGALNNSNNTAGAIFSHCYGLKDIYCNATTPPTQTPANNYNGLSTGQITLHVPEASVSAYEADDTWMYQYSKQGTITTYKIVGSVVAIESEEETEPATLVSSDPEADNNTAYEWASGEAQTITLTFSDYVKVTSAYISLGMSGQDTLGGYEGVAGTGDDSGNYKEWAITLSADNISTYASDHNIAIVIYATDANGNDVFEDDGGYTILSYYYTLTGVDVTPVLNPASGSDIESFSSVTLSEAGGAEITGSNLESEYTIYKDGEDSGYILVADDDWDGNGTTSLTFYVWKGWDMVTLTENGTYTVTFPAGTFSIGGATYNEAIEITYTIGGGSEESGEEEGGEEEGGESSSTSGTVTDTNNNTYTLSPAPGETLTQISTFTLTCEDGIKGKDLGLFGAKYVTVSLNGEESKYDAALCTVSDGVATFDFSNTSQGVLTDEGEYTITIEEGYLTLNSGTFGTLTFTYTVGSAGGEGGEEEEDVAVGDIIYYEGVAYSVTSVEGSYTVSVANQSQNSGVTSGDVVIPDSFTYDDGNEYTVTAVGMNAFYSSDISSIELPSTIKTIEDNAFNGCTKLTSIEIPEGVTTIGAGVFANCEVLESISLPNTLTSLGTKTNSNNTDGTVFSNCKALTDLTCLMENEVTLPTPSAAKYSVFNGISQEVTLWVPCGCKDLYSDWVTMMSNYSNGGTLTVSELNCESEEESLFKLVEFTDGENNSLMEGIYEDEDGNDRLDLGKLAAGSTVTVYCNKAEANSTWLEIQFGVGDNYLTKPQELLTPDEDGLFTYTIGYGYALEEGKEYDVVATLYNKEHQYDASNIIGQETILTLVGTTESTASSVTLVESDPKQEDDDVTFTAGEDGVITLTFSDYVKLDESKCYLTLGQAGGSESVAIAGVDDTDNGEDCYTQWTITVSASTLETYASEGNFSIAIGGVDCYGKTLYGNEGGIGMLTYYYTLVYEEGIDVNLVFAPENKTTVESLTTIVVSDQNYDVAYNTSSTHENIPIKKDGEATAYEVYYDGTGDPGSTVTLNIVDTTLDDNLEQNYDATITEAGVYTFTLPATMFTVGGVVYDEDVEMEYTISGSAEGGEEEGGTETGISAINAAIADGAEVYNLAGQKVNAPVKGNVYIIKTAEGTKKMLVK